jgi:hypothetical protein
MNDFEEILRDRLATLAQEAVPDGDAHVDADLANVEWIEPRRHTGGNLRRVLLVAAVVLVIVGSIAGVVAVRRDDNRADVATSNERWTKISASPLSPRYDMSAVSTGSTVIVWGGRVDSSSGVAIPASPTDSGSGAVADGAEYDLGRDRWRAISASPLVSRFGAVAAWTGKEMLVVGGGRTGGGPGGSFDFRRDGAAYNPATDTWRRLPDAPGCPQFGTWTGGELIVAGTCANTTRKFVAAIYTPEYNSWAPLPTPSVEPTELLMVGSRVVAWNSQGNRGSTLDRAANSWLKLPAMPIPSNDETAISVASGAIAFGPDRLGVVFRLSNPGPRHTPTALYDYDFVTGRWTRHENISAEGPSTFGGPIGHSPMVTGGDSRVAWQALQGFSWYDPATGDNGSSGGGDKPIRFTRQQAAFVALDNDHFFLWGGLLAGSEHDQTNRPTADGAILTLGSTPTSVTTVTATTVPALEAADAQSPAAGGCDVAQNNVGTVTLGNPDNVPQPRCLIVYDNQQLRVMNSASTPLTVSMGHHFHATIAPHGEHLFTDAVAQYLAPGVHRLAPAGLPGAEIWVDPPCAHTQQGCATP